jgi:hypothetical protein
MTLSYLFVTGCNAGYFNTLLMTLQSFALRMPGQRLLVCDYGLTPQQCEFLRRQGQLLERPPTVSPREHPYRRKAAILRYLEHGGQKFGENDVLIWIDADLTFMDVGMRDFAAVCDVMMQRGLQVAACRNGMSVGQMCEFGDREKMIPFREAVAFSGIMPNLPYYSIGIYFCRSAAFLKRWDEVTTVVKNHMCFEQNMFTLVVHRDRVPFMHIDMDEWQAQGESLGKIEIKKDVSNGPAAFIGQKNIKILHTTSSGEGHIQILDARMLAFDVTLEGMFKLFAAPDLLQLQLQLLGSCIVTHKKDLLRLGICLPNPAPIKGFELVPLQKGEAAASG